MKKDTSKSRVPRKGLDWSKSWPNPYAAELANCRWAVTIDPDLGSRAETKRAIQLAHFNVVGEAGYGVEAVTVAQERNGALYALPRSTGASAGQRLAHLSIPSELFLVPCDGSSVMSVGQTGDDVVPAWSPDGTRVAYVGSGGFFVLDVKTQTTRTVAQGQDFFFGDLLWIR